MEYAQRPTDVELKEVLQLHAEWVKNNEDQGHFLFNVRQLADPIANDPRRANLCDAYMYKANLSGANLCCADLSGANLLCADLTGADLSGADLSGVKLYSANLHRTNLRRADLTGADLSDADLSDADLTGADLTGADLNHTGVGKTKLAYTNFTKVNYGPSSEPPDPYVVGIKGLATIRARPGEQIGLVQLRKLFKDAVLNDGVREVTCAIQRSITRDQMSAGLRRPAAWIEGFLRIIGLGLTTSYGLHPERALRWILLLIVLATPAYMVAIQQPSAESGIVRVFPAGRLEGTAADSAAEERVKKELVYAQRWRQALGTAAYFSLISAVNIGFEQFTPGDWIRRLQSQEYSLEAVGWVRVVAGTQSLISVYLLAMWALTQFGKPFE